MKGPEPRAKKSKYPAYNAHKKNKIENVLLTTWKGHFKYFIGKAPCFKNSFFYLLL